MKRVRSKTFIVPNAQYRLVRFGKFCLLKFKDCHYYRHFYIRKNSISGWDLIHEDNKIHLFGFTLIDCVERINDFYGDFVPEITAKRIKFEPYWFSTSTV